MAILGLLGAEIIVDGEALPEYDDIDQQETTLPRTAVKYVEVPTGREFNIRVSASMGKYVEGIRFDVLIDGRIMDAVILPRKHKRKHQLANSSHNFSGIKIQGNDGLVKRRPWLFSDIDFVGSGDSMSFGGMSFEHFRELGTITVTAFRLKNIKTSTTPPTYNPNHDYNTVKPRGRSLKPQGITQCVILGRPRPCNPSSVVTCDYIDGETPMATLILKYRTKEALGLILRPSRNLEDESVEKLTESELQVLTSRLQDRPRDENSIATMRRIHQRSITMERETQRTADRQKEISKPVLERSTAAVEPPEPVSRDSSVSRDPSRPIPIRPKKGTSGGPPLLPNLRNRSPSAGSANPPEPDSRRSSRSVDPPEPIPNRERRTSTSDIDEDGSEDDTNELASDDEAAKPRRSMMRDGNTDCQDDSDDSKLDDSDAEHSGADALGSSSSSRRDHQRLQTVMSADEDEDEEEEEEEREGEGEEEEEDDDADEDENEGPSNLPPHPPTPPKTTPRRKRHSQSSSSDPPSSPSGPPSSPSEEELVDDQGRRGRRVRRKVDGNLPLRECGGTVWDQGSRA
ncbi:MAG: hypothetical protein L6R40_002716 [Gallowayella cf. fulva]|nr:MAG: hypothetical protein L6R40_002716 [Xanthomendoza cf. fulva]